MKPIENVHSLWDVPGHLNSGFWQAAKDDCLEDEEDFEDNDLPKVREPRGRAFLVQSAEDNMTALSAPSDMLTPFQDHDAPRSAESKAPDTLFDADPASIEGLSSAPLDPGETLTELTDNDSTPKRRWDLRPPVFEFSRSNVESGPASALMHRIRDWFNRV